VASARFADGLRRRLERRAADYIRRRQGDDRLPVVLRSRRLYILPTRAGVGFSLLLLAMFIAGLNYQNSLALFLTFLFAAFGLIALFETHRCLTGLRIERIETQPCFAGDELECGLVLEAGVARHAEELQISASEPPGRAGPAAVDPAGTVLIRLRCPTQRRGRWRLERLRLESRAPFGLFRA
jgi:uncharacterized protein (DUF58 family)